MMTNNHVRKRMLTIITISVICVFCFGYLKSTESEANEILAYDSIGNVIEAAANDLALINQEINGISAYGENDLFLTVNGIPLTKQELQFRKNLDGVSTNPRSKQELIEILIKEKVKFSLAREKGILPTEDAVASYLELEKNEASLAAEAQALCDDSALSLDDYWNCYEQYNVIRMLIDENVFKHFLSEHDYEEDYDIAVLSTDITNAYFAEIDNLVDKAEIVYL